MHAVTHVSKSRFATVADALAYLDSLGVYGIAVEFERRNMRAKIGCPEGCAIAQFIADTCNPYDVSVSNDTVETLWSEDQVQWNTDAVPLQVRLFIRAFDAGRFPNLVHTQATGTEFGKVAA